MYEKTYAETIKILAESIYNKIKNKTINSIVSGTTFRTIKSSIKRVDYWRPKGWRKHTSTQSKSVPEQTSTEKINGSYSAPTANKIQNDITIFIKNSLGLSNSALNQYPQGSDILAFVFALNDYLENTMTKVTTNADNNTTTIIYRPISGNDYDNKISLYLNNKTKANMISKTIVDEMYDTLNDVGSANNTGYSFSIQSSITSSSCSSSSSSSCSSSSSSSSSLFIAYFNLS